jgi:hypothetical protein
VLLAIGMVLAIVALVVGVVYAAFLGYLAGAMFLGRRLFGERVAAKPLYAIAAGAILIAVLDMVGELIGTVSFFIFHPVGMAFGFAAALLCFLVATAGLGALMSGRVRGIAIIADDGPSGGYAQWGSMPPKPPPSPAGAPGPQGPTVTPPTEGSSDAP